MSETVTALPLTVRLLVSLTIVFHTSKYRMVASCYVAGFDGSVDCWDDLNREFPMEVVRYDFSERHEVCGIRSSDKSVACFDDDFQLGYWMNYESNRVFVSSKVKGSSVVLVLISLSVGKRCSRFSLRVSMVWYSSTTTMRSCATRSPGFLVFKSETPFRLFDRWCSYWNW